jgi:hypothetical protein
MRELIGRQAMHTPPHLAAQVPVKAKGCQPERVLLSSRVSDWFLFTQHNAGRCSSLGIDLTVELHGLSDWRNRVLRRSGIHSVRT